MNILIQLLILTAGFILLIKGADWFVEGASKIADHFHIPQIIIGLTIVAFGTSAPEAAVGITAGLKGNSGIVLGNVLGSNVINILLILGITACITPLAIQTSTLYFEVPFVVLISAVTLFLGYSGGAIGLIEGLILWGFFVIFFLYLIQLAKKGQGPVEEVAKAEAGDSVPKLIFFTLLGLIAIVAGSDLTVDSATAIANYFKIDERFIGLTIVAFGTSLPELITSVTASLKGKNDIAIGNIIGSNIFNLLFVLGTTAVIAPVAFQPSFLLDGILCIGSAALLFLCVFRKKCLNRMGGILMLLVYGVYFAYLYTTTIS